MMIQDHYSLNIAYQGDHFARVEFTRFQSTEDAVQRAKQIAEALKQTFGVPANWSFALVKVECRSKSVDMSTKR